VLNGEEEKKTRSTGAQPIFPVTVNIYYFFVVVVKAIRVVSKQKLTSKNKLL